MSGESLNPRANASQSAFQRLAMQMKPGQPKVIRIPQLGTLQSAGMESVEKLVIVQMGGGQQAIHPRIVAFRAAPIALAVLAGC